MAGLPWANKGNAWRGCVSTNLGCARKQWDRAAGQPRSLDAWCVPHLAQPAVNRRSASMFLTRFKSKFTPPSSSSCIAAAPRVLCAVAVCWPRQALLAINTYYQYCPRSRGDLGRHTVIAPDDYKTRFSVHLRRIELRPAAHQLHVATPHSMLQHRATRAQMTSSSSAVLSPSSAGCDAAARAPSGAALDSCVRACVRPRARLRECVCVHACVRACVRVHACVRACVREWCARTQVHTHARTRTQTHTHTLTRARAHIYPPRDRAARSRSGAAAKSHGRRSSTQAQRHRGVCAVALAG
jgi:hypothetical protein